jgi:hypothetical protein
VRGRIMRACLGPLVIIFTFPFPSFLFVFSVSVTVMDRGRSDSESRVSFALSVQCNMIIIWTRLVHQPRMVHADSDDPG